MPHLFDLGAGALRLHLEVCQAVGLGTGRQHGQRLVELIQNIAAHKQAQDLSAAQCPVGRTAVRAACGRVVALLRQSVGCFMLVTVTIQRTMSTS